MFDPERFYATDDAALLTLGRPSTLAHWRAEGRGPRVHQSRQPGSVLG